MTVEMVNSRSEWQPHDDNRQASGRPTRVLPMANLLPLLKVYALLRAVMHLKSKIS